MIEFKELAHVIMGLARVKYVEQANRLETEAVFVFYNLEAELLLWETLVFYS